MRMLVNCSLRLVRNATRGCVQNEADLLVKNTIESTRRTTYSQSYPKSPGRVLNLHRHFCFESFPAAKPTLTPLSAQVRWKSRKSRRGKGAESEIDSDVDESDDDEEKAKDFQVIKGQANSTRLDAVLKLSLGMSRNKVDNAFYSSAIYLNGEKLLKKSENLTVDDEVDVVRGLNSLNSTFLDISRVQVLDVRQSRSNESKVALKVRRFKRLTVENYPQPWRAGDAD